jgi:hypothetical protein
VDICNGRYLGSLSGVAVSDSSGNLIHSPIPLVHTAIDDLEKLRRIIQSAVQLELTTVPAYLSALYSITDKSSDAYQALRTVVIEEMFHMNQAANLLVAVGGEPRFAGTAAPSYPTYLPSASRAALPYVGLYRASLLVFQNVFMAIEMPAAPDALAEGQQYKTVAQFYKAIEEALELCVAKYGERNVFQQKPGTRQRSDIYIGKFGGRAVEIRELSEAKFAVRQIMEQGEGASDPTHPLAPEEPFGTYDYYGQRIDGTYGPILGTPFELSHYFRFKRIVDSKTFPDTYPTISNPSIGDLDNGEAKNLVAAFNKYYSVILKSLEKTFLSAQNGHDVYFEVVLPLMHGHLPQLAKQIMTTPINDDGDPAVGPNAAPTFEYDASASMSEIIATLDSFRAGPAPMRQMSMRIASLSNVVADRPLPRRSAVARIGPSDLLANQRRREVLDHLSENLKKISRTAEQAGFGL